MHCIKYIVFYALYTEHCIPCIVLYFSYSIYCFLCIVLYALYYLHCMLCIVFYALHSIHYARHSIYHLYLLWNSFLQTIRPTDRPTHRLTDGPTDIVAYRAAIAAKNRREKKNQSCLDKNLDSLHAARSGPRSRLVRIGIRSRSFIF